MTDPLLQRLAAANPAVNATTPQAEIARLLSTIIDEAPKPTARPAARQRPGRRGLRRGAAATILIALVGVAAAGATTHWFSAHSGQSASTREPGDSSEILRNHGADIDEIIDALARDIPLPTGGSFHDFKAQTAADEAAQQSTTGLRASMEFAATCQWTRSWLEASSRRDGDDMARSVRVLRDESNWPATKASTNRGDLPTRVTVANAAAHHDTATVRRLYRANCAP